MQFLHGSSIGNKLIRFLKHPHFLKGCVLAKVWYQLPWFLTVFSQEEHMWLGGYPNLRKIEQSWDCTFLNLYTLMRTK